MVDVPPEAQLTRKYDTICTLIAGTGEARGHDDMQSSDKWRRPPSEEDCDIGSTESGMFFSKPAAVLCSYVHVCN